MPYRFDEESQKVVPDNATAPTRTDMAAANPAGRGRESALESLNQGQHPANQPGSSHSKIPADKMGKSRGSASLPGLKVAMPVFVKKGLIFGGASILVLTLLIYGCWHQFKFSESHKNEDSSKGETLLMPRGKKVTALSMTEFLSKLAARAVEDGNFVSGARLYGRAAEEARLAGAPLTKMYIDALFAQGEVYQYNLSDSEKSRPLFEKVLKLQSADSTTKPLKLANTYNDLADAMATTGDANKEKIQTLYQKAIALAKTAADIKGQAYYNYNAGEFYFDQGQYDKSLAAARDSLSAFAGLKNSDETDIADSHYLLARSLAHTPLAAHFELANSQFETALKTYEKAHTAEERYAPCMRDAAWNKLRLGQRSEAKELFDKASNHSEDEDAQSIDIYMGDALK